MMAQIGIPEREGMYQEMLTRSVSTPQGYYSQELFSIQDSRWSSWRSTIVRLLANALRNLQNKTPHHF